jgi:lipid-A-disaccharide synthase-like uncharacterized protein
MDSKFDLHEWIYKYFMGLSYFSLRYIVSFLHDETDYKRGRKGKKGIIGGNLKYA